MIGAVLDTNVLASGFVGEDKPDSTPGELVRRWRTKTFTLVVSECARAGENPVCWSLHYPRETGAIDEVVGSEWEGIRHVQIGQAQVWYYPGDRLLVLWECYPEIWATMSAGGMRAPRAPVRNGSDVPARSRLRAR